MAKRKTSAAVDQAEVPGGIDAVRKGDIDVETASVANASRSGSGVQKNASRSKPAKKSVAGAEPGEANGDRADKPWLFRPGQSGNPNGRPKVPVKVRQYGEIAPDRLYELATAETTDPRTKMQIWKWFAEMRYGKPRESIELESASVTLVAFEGVLKEWSE